MNTVLLSEWIVETYPTEQLKTVIKCLIRHRGSDKTWRLTPDTITEWMTVELDELADRRENYIHNRKVELLDPAHPQEISEETQKLINDFVTTNRAALTKIPSLTEEDILKEGQEKPYVPKVRYSTKEEYEEHERKLKWIRECTDLGTGRMKKGSPTYEAWLENITK